MAKFQTHLYAGVLASAAAVLTLHGAGLADERNTPLFFGLGVLGSLFPDIDADASAPVRAFFSVLGAALAFAWTLPLSGHYEPLTLGLIWVGSFLMGRFALGEAFARLTVHRGIWHSLLAALFATLTTVNLLHWMLELPAQGAWAGGLMVGIGYLTHLVLDEAVGVDLLGVRTKRSFGTALKPWSFRDPASSLIMAAVVGLTLWLAPGVCPEGFAQGPQRAEWLGELMTWLQTWSGRGLDVARGWLP